MRLLLHLYRTLWSDLLDDGSTKVEPEDVVLFGILILAMTLITGLILGTLVAGGYALAGPAGAALLPMAVLWTLDAGHAWIGRTVDRLNEKRTR